jgi:hypothetical protein|tara:strand:+ start:1171 stop:1347 length:177 start_codon:yes stop_codon:yes gene_type:complete
MQITYKQKFVAKALFYTVISPVYVPAIIIYKNRQDVYDFYKEVWKIFNGTHAELKDKD